MAGGFESEILDDETVTWTAVAFADVAAIKADPAARQEHDRDAIVVGNVARCLPRLASLKLAFPAVRDHHKINIGTTANSTIDPLRTATAQQRSKILMLPPLPWVRILKHRRQLPSLTHVNPGRAFLPLPVDPARSAEAGSDLPPKHTRKSAKCLQTWLTAEQ